MKVILGITGSVAAKLVAKIVRQLVVAGHEVKIVATEPAMYFIPPSDLRKKTHWDLEIPADEVLHVDGVDYMIYRDKAEWPASGYHKGDVVGHIDFRTWGDVLLIAPLSANTLAKLATGMCDNFLTCIARAWVKSKPLVIAPAMNTEMWIDPITDDQIGLISSRYEYLFVVEPQEDKTLACGDVGKGAMARIEDIVDQVNQIAEEISAEE